MSKRTLAGAGALLVAPVVVIVSAIVQPTFSDDASAQVAALADHRAAAIAALAISTLAAVLLIAGSIWLALAVARVAPRLAVAGGILSVFGMLVVLFEDGVSAAAPAVVAALDPAHATIAIDRVQSSAGVSAVEPLTVAGCIGLALLGAAAARAGAPRWAALAMAVGAVAETVGFAVGARAVVIAGFVVLLAGLVPVVRTLTGASRVSTAAAVAVPAA